MQCKNCETSLRTDYSYCPACGAKVIRNRITVKNLWFDIVDRYFNLDNTFLRTFLHLFSKPQTVIEGYIQGIRRKYLNPISYLGIALTLSGFILFLMKKGSSEIDFDIFGLGVQSVSQEKTMDFTFEYSSILFILYVPMMAIASWLCFGKKEYNFSERIVIFIYSLAHYSLSITIPSIFILLIVPKYYVGFSLIALTFMYIYNLYVIKKISEEVGLEFWAKGILFSALFTIMYISLSVLIPIILLVTGQLSLEDFVPKK